MQVLFICECHLFFSILNPLSKFINPALTQEFYFVILHPRNLTYCIYDFLFIFREFVSITLPPLLTTNQLISLLQESTCFLWCDSSTATSHGCHVVRGKSRLPSLADQDGIVRAITCS